MKPALVKFWVAWCMAVIGFGAYWAQGAFTSHLYDGDMGYAYGYNPERVWQSYSATVERAWAGYNTNNVTWNTSVIFGAVSELHGFKQDLKGNLEDNYWADLHYATGGTFNGWFSDTNNVDFPRLTVSNICTYAGVPTNWFDVTDWFGAVNSTNGWMYFDDVVTQMVWTAQTPFATNKSQKDSMYQKIISSTNQDFDAIKTQAESVFETNSVLSWNDAFLSVFGAGSFLEQYNRRITNRAASAVLFTRGYGVPSNDFLSATNCIYHRTLNHGEYLDRFIIEYAIIDNSLNPVYVDTNSVAFFDVAGVTNFYTEYETTSSSVFNSVLNPTNFPGWPNDPTTPPFSMTTQNWKVVIFNKPHVLRKWNFEY